MGRDNLWFAHYQNCVWKPNAPSKIVAGTIMKNRQNDKNNQILSWNQQTHEFKLVITHALTFSIRFKSQIEYQVSDNRYHDFIFLYSLWNFYLHFSNDNFSSRGSSCQIDLHVLHTPDLILKIMFLYHFL